MLVGVLVTAGLVACENQPALTPVSKALGYLRGMAGVDGGWPALKTGQTDVEDTAWAVQALVLGGEAKTSERVQKGLDYLVKRQTPEGHWNSNSAHTAFVIQALSLDASGNRPAAIEKARNWLRQAQNPDGGWPRFPGEESMTAYTGLAMVVLGQGVPKGSDPKLIAAADWLRRYQRPEKYWAMVPSQGDDGWHTRATTWAIQGLIAAGVTANDPVVSSAVSWLKSVQNADGGFPLSLGRPSDPELTAYALLALAAVGESGSEAVSKAVAYLEKVQGADGAFASGDKETHPNPKFPGTVPNTETTAFVVLGLKAVGK